ncbi:hypothetical protein BTK35_003568 [Salmonella enterica subsp. enterica serovar 4,[5],12:i:-]|nr:hypothetical protein [Salmonella enterica subsp. enterica serovar 4,[5],12:i:-]EEE0420201.1 hypothetical protein [Salmonella enterica subsp. enterica serovar 4,[5],12:i:-]
MWWSLAHHSRTGENRENSTTPTINILRHSRRFFKCAYKALLPAAP